MDTQTLETLSPLARRLLINAVYLHRADVQRTAHERQIDGSYRDLGPLSVHDICDAADEIVHVVEKLSYA